MAHEDYRRQEVNILSSLNSCIVTFLHRRCLLLRTHAFAEVESIVFEKDPHFLDFMREIDKMMSDIGDDETRQLFDELRQVTGIDPAIYQNFRALQFLQQCMYPNGSMIPVKITRDCINQVDDHDEFILRKKVGTVGDDLKRFLRGFVVGHGGSLENSSGHAIYMFLNRMLIPTKKVIPKRLLR